MKKLFLWALFALCLSGCHTIRPTNTPQAMILNDVPSLEQKVGLILDKEYQSFVSKDRGNPLADPQKYLVGEALTPLTKSFFEQATPELETYNSLDEIKSSNEKKGLELYIHPKVVQFDNTVRLSEQRIDVEIAADLYDKHLELLKTVNAKGMAQGEGWGIDVSTTVSTALQLALSNLIQEIKASGS